MTTMTTMMTTMTACQTHQQDAHHVIVESRMTGHDTPDRATVEWAHAVVVVADSVDSESAVAEAAAAVVS